MFDIEHMQDNGISELPHDAPAIDVEEKWKAWASRETQLRALLGELSLLAQAFLFRRGCCLGYVNVG